MSIRDHRASIVSALSGMALSLTAFFGIQYVKPAPKPVVISATTQRVIRDAWPGLSQIEVNSLTQALRKIDKRPVTLICIREPICNGLVLDLDNAFESAKWETTLDTLMFGEVRGILVSDQAVADAINKATFLKVKFDSTQLDAEKRLASVAGANAPVGIRIVIGRNIQ